MQKYLNREQSKELIELGISPDKASLVSWKSIKDWQGNSIFGKEQIATKPFRPAVMGFEDFDCQDIFTIGDLIEILPSRANSEYDFYKLYIHPYHNHWMVSYGEYYIKSLNFYVNEELIVALFEMVKFCMVNKIINHE